MDGKPLVVMAGWLGSQPRHLLRYRDLYLQMDLDVLSFTAEPTIIVEGSLELKPFHVPRDWPQCLSERPSSMQEFAWKILGQIHNSQAPVILFHIFSNGGCFVWEHMRRILDSADLFDPATKAILVDIMKKSKGVAFDSCPVWFGQTSGNPLVHLSQLVSKSEAADMFRVHGKALFSEPEGKQLREKRMERNTEFFDYLREDRMDVPQLYIFSDDDPITDAKAIREFMLQRKSRQTSPILECSWKKSAHCGHLREHPGDYQAAVELFAKMALQRSKL